MTSERRKAIRHDDESDSVVAMIARSWSEPGVAGDATKEGQ